MSARYTAAKAIVDAKTLGPFEGGQMDLYTASAMVSVYEALSEKSRANFDAVPLTKLIAFIWKQVHGS